MSKDLFKREITNYLGINPQNIFLFWKGRVALYAILKAIGIGKNDDVILPAFTCVVAVNPIIYLRARPVYVDIDPKTYNMDPNKIEARITSRTKVILAQNTFGLAPDLDATLDIADKYNFFVVEDCAHGFGGKYKGKLNGTIADASFFSSQWNKPFSTGLGGMAVTKREDIARKLSDLEKKAVPPSFKDVWMLRLLLFARNRFLTPNLYWQALKAYRFLSKYNIVLGSSQGYELEKPVMPEDFLKGFSTVQAKEGLKYFEKVNGRYRIDLVIEHRRKVARFYKEVLTELGVEPPFEPDYAEHTFLKFPLLVRDRKRFFAEAERERIELGDWFISPIHPITKNFELWYYRWGENPVAEKISQHIVNLPTHPGVDDSYAARVAEFLKRNRNLLFPSNSALTPTS